MFERFTLVTCLIVLLGYQGCDAQRVDAGAPLSLGQANAEFWKRDNVLQQHEAWIAGLSVEISKLKKKKK